METALYEELFRLEAVHWWCSAKRHIVLSVLQRFLSADKNPPAGKNICDVGCGCGMMLLELKRHSYNPVGIDDSDYALEYCKSRGVSALRGSLPDAPPVMLNGKMDAVLLLDVLEHVYDDRSAILAAYQLLRPGGIIICTVPAYPWLWTKRDEFHHHKRRYSMNNFLEMLRCPGGQIILASFMNTFLFPIALAGRLTAKLLPERKKTTDLSVPPFGLNKVLKNIFAAERHLLTNRIVLPFGLSLIGVVRKPA